MQMARYWNFPLSIYATNVLFSYCSFNSSEQTIPRSPTKLLTASCWRSLEFSITSIIWNTVETGVFRGAAKIAGENVEVVNIEHGSRGEGKNRRKIHSLRWPGENKREKGNRGKEEASRGVVVSHPFSGRRVFTLSGGWVMRTVHAINLICRVEKLSELNPATMGRRRKRAVNSIRFRHTRIQRPLRPYACPRSFVVSTSPSHLRTRQRR